MHTGPRAPGRSGRIEIPTGEGLTSPPVTIARKGSSKPLIDTDVMRQGVSWELF